MTRVTPHLLGSTILTLCLTVVLTLAANLGQAQEQENDLVVIQLGDEVITTSQFEEKFNIAARNTAVQQGLEPTKENLAQFESLRKDFLDHYATQIVLLNEAEQREISSPEAEVDAQVQQIREGFEDAAAYQEYLTSAGFRDEAHLRENIEDVMLAQLVIQDLAADITISEEEIAQFYEANPEQFTLDGGPVDLEVVREDISLMLTQQEIERRISALREASGVQVYPENL